MPSYPGGKSGCGVYHRLAREIPPHDERIVPFLGHCAILRNVRPAALNVGIELDAEVLRTYWTPAGIDQLAAGDGRFEFNYGDGVEWLRWRFKLTRWPLDSIAELTPAQVLAALYGGPAGERPPIPFVFADPPYPEHTCSSGRVYRCSMTDKQHAELLQVLKRIPALTMIVSYPNKLYAGELRTWRTFRYAARRARGRARRTHRRRGRSIRHRSHLRAGKGPMRKLVFGYKVRGQTYLFIFPPADVGRGVEQLGKLAADRHALGLPKARYAQLSRKPRASSRPTY